MWSDYYERERKEREQAQRASRRAHLTCSACQADTADIGAFDHGLPHTLDPQNCDMTSRDVDACGRTGNHFYHLPVADRMAADR